MLVRQRRRMLGGLILAVAIAAALIGIRDRSGEEVRPPQAAPEGGVRFGDVVVDPGAREIRFDGDVRQHEGWVRFAVCLQGYRWLEEEAAVLSSAHLTDLQKAIALLDWQLWDRLWHRETTGHEVDVVFEWPGRRVNVNDLLQLPYRLGIGDLVFLGSPLFDPLFMARCAQTVVCAALNQRAQCPLYFLQESVNDKFTRASGDAGYWLDGDRWPPPGTRVSVVIRVPEPTGGG
jgi:hypothetical protein